MDLRIAPSALSAAAVPTAPARPTESAQVPPELGDTVQVTTYHQDPLVGKPEVVTVDRAKVGSGLSNERVKISDTRPKAKPDSSGNFIMTPGSDGDAQVNAQVVTTRTLDMWEGYRGGRINWSFGGPSLEVVPHKREGMNAYYSRWEASTNYFYQNSPQLNTVVKTANSTDVVAHETGHAILDGMKPGFLSAYDRETSSFHESFGDCTAMLATLHDPVLNQRIVDQTGGDLRKPNNVAHLAEEFGKAVKLSNTDPKDDNNAWLRNALNPFTYVPPESLGDGRGDDDTLGGQIHSFSRLFSGAFYDCIEAAYNQGLESSLPPAVALKSAETTLGPLFARAVDRLPANRGRFKDVALGLIAADKEKNGGKLGDAMKKVFLDRKILKSSDIQAEEERRTQLPSLTVDHNFTSPEAVNHYVSARREQLGLPLDVDLQTVAMSVNEQGEQVLNLLYSREVPVTGVPGLEGLTTDVTGGVTLAFDERGKLSEFRHQPIDDESIRDEMEGIAFLQRKAQILQGDRSQPMIFTRSDGKPYQAVVMDGKLTRIPSSSCDCGSPGCQGH